MNKQQKFNLQRANAARFAHHGVNLLMDILVLVRNELALVQLVTVSNSIKPN